MKGDWAFVSDSYQVIYVMQIIMEVLAADCAELVNIF